MDAADGDRFSSPGARGSSPALPASGSVSPRDTLRKVSTGSGGAGGGGEASGSGGLLSKRRHWSMSMVHSLRGRQIPSLSGERMGESSGSRSSSASEESEPLPKISRKL